MHENLASATRLESIKNILGVDRLLQEAFKGIWDHRKTQTNLLKKDALQWVKEAKKRGKDNIVVDALSRKWSERDQNHEDVGKASLMEVTIVTLVWLSKVSDSYIGDPKAIELLMELAIKAP
ncbi:hypothetical protein ACH5RR_040686 [Cinchona calisaya]|uniref:Uncharacterized protein n=1 Tax=Cinchona calisaya TaxID=153742 RepID=A0ABD2XS89_9GENT